MISSDKKTNLNEIQSLNDFEENLNRNNSYPIEYDSQYKTAKIILENDIIVQEKKFKEKLMIKQNNFKVNLFFILDEKKIFKN